MKNYTIVLLVSLLLSGFLTDHTFSQATMETGSMGIVVNTWGRMRVYLPDATAGVKQIERISVLVGVDNNSVYDYQNDSEVEEPTTLVSTPQLSDFEITALYNNAALLAPPDVLVRYNIYSWTNAKYAILKFTITNRETNAINAKIGLDIIPNLDATYGNDTVSFSNVNQIIRFHRGGVNAGIKLLSHSLQSLYSFEWYDAYYVDSSYWNWLNYGSIQAEYFGGVEGPVTIPSIDFINLNPLDSVEIYCALAFGDEEAELISQITEAQQKYNQIVSVESDLNNVPLDFTLEQNYPNPFNPSTKISFGLPQRSGVVLKIFNALGQQVAELVNESLEAGTYSYNFDATELTSGIYIYSLQTDAGVISKKMTLIK